MSRQSKNDPIEFSCEVKHETDNAYLVSDDGERDIWIPKSHILAMEGDSGCVEMTIPEWLAIEKEIV